MDTEPAPADTPQRRWPGVVFSLFVPGFGLFRGGQVRRGIAWMLGGQIIGIACGLLLALEAVPTIVALIGLAFALIAGLWMLRDSFCPGRMTPRLWKLFIILFSLFVLLPTPGSLIARSFKIPTGAMEPTLMGARDGNTPDHFIVDCFSYLFSNPKRGDLVVFKTSGIPGIRRLQSQNIGEGYYVKRLIGLPGEQIEISDGAVYADGEPLGESDGIPPIQYTDYDSTAPTVSKANGVYAVGDSEYFVLGDNSPNSNDSRSWGYVPESAIIGKVTRIWFPFSRMGTPRFEPTNREQDEALKP